MGEAQKSLAYIEPDEYLLLEANAKEKHEYMDGAIYAWQGSTVRGMAGTSLDHARVVMNTYVSLRNQLGADCEMFVSEVRLRPDDRSAYFYPDLMARCGPNLSGNSIEVSDAVLVVEVLSDTTESFDRNDKFARYRRMTSLQSYVLISPARRTIEVFRADQAWQPPTTVYDGSDQPCPLGVQGWWLRDGDVFDGLQTPKGSD